MEKPEQYSTRVKCDSCGKNIKSNIHPIIDENHNIQKGLSQCEKCYVKSIK